ncbi:uncharacterized protein LOC119320183 isoform X2 [Triticum dicoccoides]|uniref:uncharacterized protein LOC119320183 isoform X2 n=1 Tax=Triticum dicoccoides TaxID=85692 RepID=UPI0018912A4E|nr:uncharacterized protein LOC119320183 isoform X2 [Triticum dicoccoides]
MCELWTSCPFSTNRQDVLQNLVGIRLILLFILRRKEYPVEPTLWANFREMDVLRGRCKSKNLIGELFWSISTKVFQCLVSTKTIYKRFSKGGLKFATTTKISLWNNSVWLFCVIFLSSRGMSSVSADTLLMLNTGRLTSRGIARSGGQPLSLPVLFDARPHGEGARGSAWIGGQPAGIMELDMSQACSPHNLQSRSLTYSGSRSQKQNLHLIYLAQNILAQQFHALDIFL